MRKPYPKKPFFRSIRECKEDLKGYLFTHPKATLQEVCRAVRLNTTTAANLAEDLQLHHLKKEG